jgi:hypothetical protein
MPCRYDTNSEGFGAQCCGKPSSLRCSFLTIADGVIRAQGRKIIFSTNLPNVNDLDDALIRPGRRFSRLMLRELCGIEVRNLSVRLCMGDQAKMAQIMGLLPASDRDGYSIAEIYRQYELVNRQLESVAA